MGKGWVAIAFCAALCACGQGHDKPGNDKPGLSNEAATSIASARSGGGMDAPPPAFAVCASCHSVEPGHSSIGPSLAGVFGRKAAGVPGYAYSDALKGSGIVWDAKSLDTWLQGPMKMVPGTKMIIGISDPAGRKAVIDYLETLK